MQLSAEFIRDCIGDKIDYSVAYAIRRAFKHSDEKPPSDDQIQMICDIVRNDIIDIFDWGIPE